jgi:hypothetical protein
MRLTGARVEGERKKEERRIVYLRVGRRRKVECERRSGWRGGGVMCKEGRGSWNY